MPTRYFRLEPEVAGELGPKTRMDRGQVPPKVERLHYVFDGWSGDELVESYPCFIVTRELGEHLVDFGATGFRVRDLEISTSESFQELYPNQELPDFRWLDVVGEPRRDDLAI